MQAARREDLSARCITEKLTAAGPRRSIARRAGSCHAAPPRAGGRRPARAPAGRDRGAQGPARRRAGAGDRGFLQRRGLASLDQCEKRDNGKGEFWFAVVAASRAARPPRCCRSCCRERPAPVPLAEVDALGRPATSAGCGRCSAMLALLDGEVVPLGVRRRTRRRTTTAATASSRPQPFPVDDFADYRTKLRERLRRPRPARAQGAHR